jgi:hypothetical protein
MDEQGRGLWLVDEHGEPPDDFELATWLLEGMIISTDGDIYRREYLKSGPQEIAGREALTRILLSGRIPRGICFALAELFALNSKNPRRLEFGFRSQNRSDKDRDLLIALKVWEMRQAGTSAESAYAEMASKTSLSERQIQKICAKHRSYNEAWDGPLPKRGRRSK